jgi:ketosteroid isomerase-like protein
MIDYHALLAAIDRRDWTAFGAFLTDDVTFRYGSQAAVTGKPAVLAAAEAAVAPFLAVAHTYDRDWTTDTDAVVAGQVAYMLGTGETIALPFLNRFTLVDGRIREYLIYIDASPVFNALHGAAA